MLTLGQSALEVCFRDQSAEEQIVYQYPCTWLRDNCFCSECAHPDIQERLAVTSEITADIVPNSVKIEDHQLVIEWNKEQHLSRYSSSGFVQ